MNKVFEFVGLWLWAAAMLLCLLTMITHKGIWVRWAALLVLTTMITVWWMFK